MSHGHIGKLFWDFHNYQDLQYMYLSLRLKTFVNGFMIIQICIVIKDGDLLELLW